MKTNLSKKTRALVEQYILRHASLTCNIRRPYVVATCNIDCLSYFGIGIAKWNPNDAGISKWEWNEPRGCDIAIGRAVVDLIYQMGKYGILGNYVAAALLEHDAASEEDDNDNDTDNGFIGYYLKKEKESSNEEYTGPGPAAATTAA